MSAEPFETIVARHHAEIFRFLARMTARAGEADDLAQETFLRAFRAYRALPPDANVRAWLYTIAGNLARNHFRAEGRRRTAHAALGAARTAADGGGPESEALLGEAWTLLEGSVARLPLRQRMALIMRKVHDLDYDTIARSLACSPEAARAHVFQAMRKIRRSLNGHELAPGEPPR